MLPKPHPIRFLIVYYSRFGAVKALAEEIKVGAQEVPLAKVDLDIIELGDQPIAASRRAQFVNRVARGDALVVGSPGYFGGMASPVKRFFEDCLTAEAPPETDRTRAWRAWRFHDKVGAAFTSTATPHGGNEQTLHSILTMFMHLGMVIVTPGQQEPILEHAGAPYGATTVSGPTGDRPPTDEEKRWAQDLGRRVVETALWLQWGRDEWARLRDLSSKTA